MRVPSRKMPSRKTDAQLRFIGIILLALALPAAGLLVWSHPWLLAGGLILVAAHIIEKIKFKRMAVQRRNERICSFARTFERTTTNFWIVRAVYEEFVLATGGVPIRKSDLVYKDLSIDGDELEDMLLMISQRVGLSTEDWEKNPVYSNVATVADLVSFLQHQPVLKTS